MCGRKKSAKKNFDDSGLLFAAAADFTTSDKFTRPSLTLPGVNYLGRSASIILSGGSEA